MDKISIKTKKGNEKLKEIYNNASNNKYYYLDLYEKGITYPANYQAIENIKNMLSDHGIKFTLK